MMTLARARVTSRRWSRTTHSEAAPTISTLTTSPTTVQKVALGSTRPVAHAGYQGHFVDDGVVCACLSVIHHWCKDLVGVNQVHPSLDYVKAMALNAAQDRKHLSSPPSGSVRSLQNTTRRREHDQL